MEVTTEFLNKIEGRPEWLGEWRLGIAFGDAFWYCKRPSKSRFALYVNEEGVVFAADPNLRSSDNLQLALYARRIEIEVERRMKVGAP